MLRFHNSSLEWANATLGMDDDALVDLVTGLLVVHQTPPKVVIGGWGLLYSQQQ